VSEVPTSQRVHVGHISEAPSGLGGAGSPAAVPAARGGACRRGKPSSSHLAGTRAIGRGVPRGGERRGRGDASVPVRAGPAGWRCAPECPAPPGLLSQPAPA